MDCHNLGHPNERSLTLYRVTKGTAGTPIQDPIVNDKLSALGVLALFSSANARAAKACPSK